MMFSARPRVTAAARLVRTGRLTGLLVSLALLAALALGVARPLAPSAVAQSDASLPPSAKLAPETTLFYFSLDLDLNSAQWQQAQTLLQRAGFPDELDRLQQRLLDQLATTGTPTAGATTNPFLGGEVAFAVSDLNVMGAGMDPFGAAVPGLASPVASPPGERLPGPVAIIRPGDPDAAWAVINDRIQAHVSTQGGQIETSTYRDVEIRSLAGGNMDRPHRPAIARLDDAIVIGTSPDDLHAVIDTATGNAPALADLPAVADLRAELNPDLMGFGFANGERSQALLDPSYIAQMTALFPQLGSQLQNAVAATPGASSASGTPAASPTGGNAAVGLWADDPGFRLDTVASPSSAMPLTIQPQNVDLTLDQRVPSNALMFQSANLGSFSIFSVLGPSLAPLINQAFGEGTLSPALATPGAVFSADYVKDAKEQIALASRNLGFDLQADFLDQLVGTYGFSVSISPLRIATGNGVSAILVSDVDDEATVQTSLTRIARLIEQRNASLDVSTRLLKGAKIYVVRSPDIGGVPPVEFGVVDRQLLVGLGPAIDDYVNGPPSSLADDEQYQRVLATLPSEYYYVSYVNIRRGIDLLDLLRSLSSSGSNVSATPVAGAAPNFADRYGATQAFAQVAYQDGDLSRSSSILYIAESSSSATPVA
jgi:hypothetical protein